MGRERQQARTASQTPTPAARTAAPAPEVQQLAGNGTAQGYMNAGERRLEDGTVTYGAAQEETGFLGETMRMVDQALARAELSSRFDVVPNDFVGPRLPNQVTQDEFDRITTMYSDIRNGRTNFEFGETGDEEADADFQQRAMGDIATILTTTQGRELVDSLAYGDVDGERRSIMLGNVDNPARAGTDIAPGENAANMFNGIGVDTQVNYAAGRDVDMADVHRNYQTAQYRHSTSDQILFHELIHAQHYRNGLVNGEILPDGSADIAQISNREAVIRNDRGVTEEEYQTVGLMEGSDYTENAYRAERALVTGEAIPQRDNYNGNGPRRR